MSELPTGWAEASLADLLTPAGLINDGDWIESKDQDPRGDIRLIQLMDIGDGHFRNRSRRFINRPTAERLNCTFLQPGDLLIARMPDPLGRACVFPGVGADAVTAVDVLIWRGADGAADTQWLKYAINSPDVRAELAMKAGGTTRQRIAGGKLKDLRLPIPPLAEQRRIVAKLDALTARTARARADLDRIPALAARYRDAVLANAFQPDPGELVALNAVVEDGLIGLVRSRSNQHPTLGSPYVRMQHFDLRGRWNDQDLTRVHAAPAEVARFGLCSGDVLFNTRNSIELVGKVALCGREQEGSLYNNNLLRLRFRVDVEPEFAFRQMQAPSFRVHLEGQKSATTSVAAIYQSTLYNTPFWIPSLDRQRRIVRGVEAAFNEIDRLAAEASAARRLLDRLDQAVLAKAIRGDLVPQDPTDEPASALLERLRTSRVSAPRQRRRETAT